jgi:16S rRNA (uracil1498-N3)-methyltransferase
MLPRVIIQGIELRGKFRLPPEDERHIFSALRMRGGERLTLCDGHGLEALCVLTADREASVVETYPSQGEPLAAIHLYPSLSKGERFEWMLQKAAELGAATVTPVLSERCVAGSPAPAKPERWRRILRSAAEQSGRGVIPGLRDTVSFGDAVKTAQGLRVFCYEDERTVTLRSVFREGVTETSVLTGPEGGYTPEEAELAAREGWTSVSLGKTVLRCETAPLMVLSAISYLSMEM